MADACGPVTDGITRVRSLFISDVHLGTRDAQAERLLHLLQHHEAERIYLVGDIVDGWRLKANWYWPPSHDAVVQYLLHRLHSGTRVLYIPGNHDEFLRNSLGLRLGGIEIVDHAIHHGADGRRHLVVHGDQFDSAMTWVRRLADLGILVYAAAVVTNEAARRWRRRFARLTGSARRHAGGFARLLADEAKRRQVQGVICGHIHQPEMHENFGVQYINTGDWVHSCTAAVEHVDGSFELLHWPATYRQTAAPPPRASIGAWAASRPS